VLNRQLSVIRQRSAIPASELLGSIGEISGTPASKSVIIIINPSRDAAEAMRQWVRDSTAPV
jgi:hypothetical protein